MKMFIITEQYNGLIIVTQNNIRESGNVNQDDPVNRELYEGRSYAEALEAVKDAAYGNI